MSLPEQDAAPPNVEIDSIRYLHRPGARNGTVSIVVGGVHHLFPCKPAKAVYFVEDFFGSIRKDSV